MDLWILWMLCAVSLLAQESCSALTISGCKDGRVDVVEDSNHTFTCGEYGSSGAVWTVYSDKGQILYHGSCQYTSCSYLDDNVFLVEWYFRYYNYLDFYTSSLTITRIKRDSARILNCSSSSESTVCKLRIIATPEYGDCSVSISNWMVTGRCAVKRMYSLDNNYICKWREKGNNNEEIGGFQNEPVYYTSWNSRNYTQGIRSFAKPMSVISGYYTYIMRVSPGGVSFPQTINIGEPYQIKLNHSCPKYVFEGSNINCSCSASRVVTPPALLVWEGRNDSTLLLANISRQQNQEQYTCQLKWGPDGSIKENTSYTLIVAWNTQANTAGLNAGLIGGLITAVLVLIIAAVLIVYIIKRRKGVLDRERCFGGVYFFSRKHFDHGPAMSQPYAVINKPKTQTQTQTPIRRQAGPAGDMYTITNTISSGHVVDDYAEVCKTANNKNTGGTEISDIHQATQKTQSIEGPKVSLKPTVKSTIANKTNFQDLHGTVYMNITEVPTDSGLGVYHVVPWATKSGSTEPETSEYSVPTIFEDEYNELHFKEDRTGQEDQADNYHHLQIT